MPTGGADILLAIGAASTATEATALAATIGGVLETAGIGAAIGGTVGGVTNGSKGILKGAEAGGLAGLGGGVGGLAGIGAAGSALGGAAGGALGAEVTGGDPLLGAAEGGIGSGISSLAGGNSLFGSATPGTGAATGTPITGGTPGGAVAAPSGVGTVGGGDVTAGTDQLSTIINQGGAGAEAAAENGGISSATGSSASNPFSTANTGAGVSAPASSSNVSQTVGTPSISGSPSGSPYDLSTNAGASRGVLDVFGGNTGGTPIATAVGGANPSSATDSFVSDLAKAQSAEAPVTDAISANSPLLQADPSLNQPSILQNITGSSAPIAQSPIANAASGVTTASTVPPGNSIFNAIKGTGTWETALGQNSGALLSGAGLAGTALMNKSTLPGQKELSNIAGSLAAQGQSLQEYLKTGTLPPGLQGALDVASNDAVASIKSQYAAHGMSGSSAEQEAIAAAHERAQASASQMALQLLQTGVSESEGASALYQSIMNSALQQDNALGTAIGRFATSAAGGNPGLNISQAGGKLTIG